MALVEVPGWPVIYPSLVNGETALSISSVALDADGEKFAFTFPAPKDGTINRVGFRIAAVTQAPTNGLTVSLQDLDASGDPDGGQDQLREVAVGEIAANTWITTGLLTSDGTDIGTKRTVTQGQRIAAVVEFTSFSLGDSITVSSRLSGAFSPGSNTPGTQIYGNLFTTAWGNRVNCLTFAVQYSDDVWEPVSYCLPIETVFSTAFDSADNPDERGMQFVCPASMRAVGIIANVRHVGAASTEKFILYDSANNILASANVAAVLSSGSSAGTHLARFDDVADSVDLESGSTYKITVQATHASDTIILYGAIPDSTDFSSAMPWGEDAVGISRQDGTGSFTEATDGINYAIGLLVDAIDVTEASSGGGNVIIRRFYED